MKIKRELTYNVKLITCLLFLVTGVLIIGCEAKTEEAAPPNILFIAIDDLNDWVEPLGGHPQAKTPNLNEFAAQAVTFTNAHASAPLCNPSRVSMLTGLHPKTTGVVSNNAFYPFRNHVPHAETIFQYFSKAGYHTAGWGKIFHKDDSKTEPWDEYDWASGRPKPDPFPGHGIKFLTDSVYRYFDWARSKKPIEKWGEHKATNGAIEFLKREQQDPFFMAVGFRLPHLAWYVPEEFYAPFDSLDIQLPDFDSRDIDDIPEIILNETAKDRKAQDTIMMRGAWQDAVKAYLATVHYIDYELGRILKELETSGQSDNTIVVIWSDHGFHLGEKSTWRKNTLWEESTRVPLFIKAPGISLEDQEIEHPVSLLDVYPTLVQLCGLQEKPDLDGQSIVPLLENTAAKLKRDYVVTTNAVGSSVRTEDWRYILYNNGAEELYDRSEDPLERNNLASSETYSVQKQELKALLAP